MLSESYYSDIAEIPIANWWKVKAGELKYCRKDLSKGSKQSDLKAYISINDSYILEFGIGADMERVIDLRRQIMIAQCDYVIESNNFLRNQIRRLEKELSDLLENDTGIETDDIVIILEKWRGIAIEEKITTAKKYYKILGAFEREQKELRKKQS